ncbi:fimbrial protein pilin [Caballeronia peredens]|nr:fimbrial protein pilin [Caballeronia peredens]
MKIRSTGKIIRSTQKGFTLIELMITVGIIGSLAAVALPAYTDYQIRGQVTEGILLMEGFKTKVTEYFAVNGHFPYSISNLGETTFPSGKYVSMTQEDGMNSNATNDTIYLTATYSTKANAKIAGKQLSLIGTSQNNGPIQWTCTSQGQSIPKRYLPTSCQ